MTSVPLTTIVPYLDELLRIGQVPDSGTAWNGLQVENSGSVERVIAAVDASQATIDGVVTETDGRGKALLLVHHGLFWDGIAPVTERRYRRLKALLDHDIACYSAHIPLDVHAEYGNNAVLCHLLGVRDPVPFGAYKGIALGLAGSLDLTRPELAARLEELLGSVVRILPGGPERVRRVAVITGAAAGYVREAMAAGCDTLITGEGMHHTYFDAMEYGVNVAFAGHYATEQVGVRALAAHLGERFAIPWTFHHHPTGL